MLCFGKLPLVNNFLDKKGGGEYQENPSKFFCLRVPKNFIGEHFSDVFWKFSGSEKFMGKRG